MNTETVSSIILKIFNEMYYEIFGYSSTDPENNFVAFKDLGISQEEFQMYGITHNSLYKEIMKL